MQNEFAYGESHADKQQIEKGILDKVVRKYIKHIENSEYLDYNRAIKMLSEIYKTGY